MIFYWKLSKKLTTYWRVYLSNFVLIASLQFERLIVHAQDVQLLASLQV